MLEASPPLRPCSLVSRPSVRPLLHIWILCVILLHRLLCMWDKMCIIMTSKAQIHLLKELQQHLLHLDPCGNTCSKPRSRPRYKFRVHQHYLDPLLQQLHHQQALLLPWHLNSLRRHLWDQVWMICVSRQLETHSRRGTWCWMRTNLRHRLQGTISRALSKELWGTLQNGILGEVIEPTPQMYLVHLAQQLQLRVACRKLLRQL